MACLSFRSSRRADQVHKTAARRGRAAVFLAVGLAGVLVLAPVAGCGRGRLAYVNARYRFALTYDAALVPADRAEPAAFAGGRPAYVIAFLDAGAPQANGRYVDGVWVAVMRLPAGAHWPPPQPLRPNCAGAWRLPLCAGSRLGDRDDDAAGGRTRRRSLGYSYRLGGTAVQALTYVLVKGPYEYQLTLQAAAARWPDMLPRLTQSVDSFTVR